MTHSPATPRDLVLSAPGHVLVTGGPGAGKTTLALEKALQRIDAGLATGQSVLFLSFSRAAVVRLVQASATQIPTLKQEQLCLQTFHSFFWELLRTHGYLLGAPRRLQILLPHDERALSGGAKPETPTWATWETRREQLFHEEGRIAFDLFAPKSCEVIRRSALIRSLVVKQYPLIIVDEAQDTGEHAWMFVAALKNDCQIVCLADLEQQIFDYLPGIGPERIAAIRNELCPLEVDLGQTNNRSPGTEIAIFAKDVLQNTPRRAPYNGVSRLAYNPIAWDRSRTLRTAIAIVMRSIGEQTGVRPESCAILASTARDVAVISAALSAEPKPVTHKVIFDEVGALLASRFAAFLLEPKYPTDKAEHIAEALELLAAIERSAGTKKGRKTSARYQKWAQEVRQGQQPRAKVVKTLAHLIETLCSPCFQGDPVKDWLAVKMMIRDGGDAAIASMTGLLDYLVAFNRGRRIAANLSALWMELGTYAYARQALDAALAQEALLAGPDDLTGIHVMTIHRSKAKQFDGVILFRSNTPTGPRTWRSSFVWRDDKPPYTRSRKILRVGITRAQKHVLIVDPAFPECPLLHGHIL